MNHDGFERAASASDLPVGEPVSIELSSGESICLVRVADEVFGFEDRCSHAAFPMSDGEMVDEFVVECALHGAQFDIRTGEALAEPATESLALFEVRLDGDDVWVRRRE